MKELTLAPKSAILAWTNICFISLSLAMLPVVVLASSDLELVLKTHVHCVDK